MSTALARIGSTALSIQDVMSVGGMLAKSRYFQDASQEAQAVAKILAGQELGIPPVAAMTGIHVISGKISLSSNIIASIIKRSGKYNYRVRKLDAEVCEIEFFETSTPAGQLPQWESIGVSSLSMAEAKAADMHREWSSAKSQMVDKVPWKKFPRNMLFARAISNGARWYCPDVFNGPIYTPEELGAQVNEEGEVIDVLPSGASFEPPPLIAVPTEQPTEAPQSAGLSRDELIIQIRKVKPTAESLGVKFPATAPKDLSLAELQTLYDSCLASMNIDP